MSGSEGALLPEFAHIRRPRLLDLYSCAGGAGAGYARAGFEVVGVDIDPQPNYPFEFHQADAIEYLAAHGHEYDVIHTTAPCQGYLNLGAVNRKLGRKYDHPDLIAATRELLIDSGKPYIIENVQDARKQLIDPVRICGTGLGQPIRRHRLFESNVPLTGIACAHHRYTEPKYWTGWRPKGEHRLSTVVQIYGNAGGREHWPAALGIDWMSAKEMTECVPPSYTEHLGRQLIERRTGDVTAPSDTDAVWEREHHRVVRSHGCDDAAPECACGSPLTPHLRITTPSGEQP